LWSQQLTLKLLAVSRRATAARTAVARVCDETRRMCDVTRVSLQASRLVPWRRWSHSWILQHLRVWRRGKVELFDQSLSGFMSRDQCCARANVWWISVRLVLCLEKTVWDELVGCKTLSVLKLVHYLFEQSGLLCELPLLNVANLNYCALCREILNSCWSHTRISRIRSVHLGCSSQ